MTYYRNQGSRHGEDYNEAIVSSSLPHPHTLALQEQVDDNQRCPPSPPPLRGGTTVTSFYEGKKVTSLRGGTTKQSKIPVNDSKIAAP